MNMLSNLQQIGNIIIRPSRYTYKVTDLGNKCFKIDDKQVQRQDFQVKNTRGMRIKCSLYTSERNYKHIQTCIIYLHCNSGCRVQGLAYLKQALDHNYSYVVFDFTGSGLSQGKFVSLGYYQTMDLQCVFGHVKSIISQTGRIILWGRSMGAVTGLNFLLQQPHHHPNIAFAIFDSPFRSLRDLFIQIGRQKTSFPQFILQMAYNYLKPIIQQKAGFNIQEVDLKLENNSISCPCVFIASKRDTLVPYRQIDQIFGLYKGQKQLVLIDQGHNQQRNTKVISQVFAHMKKTLAINQQLLTQRKLKQQQQQRQKKQYHSQVATGSSNNNDNSSNNNNNKLIQKKQLSRKKLELTIKSLSHRQLVVTNGNNTSGKDGGEVSQQRRVSGLGGVNYKHNHNVIKLRIRDQQGNNSNSQSVEKNILNYAKSSHNNSNQPAKTIMNQHPYSNSHNHHHQQQLLEKKPLSCMLQKKSSLKPTSYSIEQDDPNRYSFQPSTERKVLNMNKSQSKLKVKRKPLRIGMMEGDQNEGGAVRKQEDGKTERGQGQQLRVENNKSKCQPLGERKGDNISNVQSSRQQCPKQMTVKTIPLTQHTSKPTIHPLSLHKQKQQPHSDIKIQSQTKQKINFHQDFIREKEFLKRSESLQKVFKIENLLISDKKAAGYSQRQPTTTQTYRQIKCTQRVLQKIIQKQQRKLLILNLQQNSQKSQSKKQKNTEVTDNKQQQKVIQSQRQQQDIYEKKKQGQRKTFQHMVNKSKPFLELKGVKNVRNSLEGKYKTEMRK